MRTLVTSFDSRVSALLVNRLIANTFILFGRVMDFRCVAINLEIFWYQARIEEPIDIRVRIKISQAPARSLISVSIVSDSSRPRSCSLGFRLAADFARHWTDCGRGMPFVWPIAVSKINLLSRQTQRRQVRNFSRSPISRMSPRNHRFIVCMQFEARSTGRRRK